MSGEPPRDAHSVQRAKNAWNIGVSGVFDDVCACVCAATPPALPLEASVIAVDAGAVDAGAAAGAGAIDGAGAEVGAGAIDGSARIMPWTFATAVSHIAATVAARSCRVTCVRFETKLSELVPVPVPAP
jgi:hypothetical protein